MVVNCHIIAAGMHFLGLKELSSEPNANVIAPDVKDSDLKRRWKVFHVLGRLVDHYVIVHKHADIQPNALAQSPVTAKSVEANPHAIRIQDEHYSSSLVTQIAAEHCCVDSVPEKRKKRHPPPWLWCPYG